MAPTIGGMTKKLSRASQEATATPRPVSANPANYDQCWEISPDRLSNLLGRDAK